jgi:hypothetical protein
MGSIQVNTNREADGWVPFGRSLIGQAESEPWNLKSGTRDPVTPFIALGQIIELND